MAELDETKDTQDTTSEDTEDTSEKEPETFTKEQVTEAERKAKSDALAESGRLRVTADKAIKAAQAAQTQVTQMIKDQEDAELRDAAGDTEKLSAIKERQLRRMAEANLAAVKSELDGKDEELKSANAEKAENAKERNAREIASRLSVDAKSLARLAKFTDGSTEAIEEIAKELPKKGEKDPLKVDSGKTTGGSANFDKIRDEMIKNPSNDAKMKRYLDAKKAQGG